LQALYWTYKSSASIDEGRDEKLYEMEIAFEQIPKDKVPLDGG
jgi:uncharacterized protein (DUF2126 family)